MSINRIEYRAIYSAITVLMLTAAPLPSQAQQFEPTWQLEFDLAFVDSAGDNVLVDVGIAGVDVNFDTKAGAGLRAEYQFAESLAAEFGFVGTASFGATVGDLNNNIGVATRVSSFTPFTVGLNYHVGTEGPVDFYLGPFLSIVRYGDVETEVGTGGVAVSVSVDTDYGWGAIAGLDVPIGSGHWSLQTNIRYIDTNMKGTNDGDPFDIDFDPFIFSIGFGYRF